MRPSIIVIWFVALAASGTQAQTFFDIATLDDAPFAFQVTRFRIDLDELTALAASAPAQRLDQPLGAYGVKLNLPDPSGAIIPCFAADSPVMDPALAAKFPQIRTLMVASADGRASGRLEVSPSGLTAMLRTPDGSWMIDGWTKPDEPRDPLQRVSYWLHDVRASAHDGGWSCETVEGPHGHAACTDSSRGAFADRGGGPGGTVILRTVRLAVACTGEYGRHQSQILGHAPNAADALAAITVTVARVNVIFEADLAVHFTLVANNDLIVYFDPATDPYPNTCDGSGAADCSGPYLGPNINTLASVIGNANFDVGHLLTRVFGGVAYLSSVCGGNKAGGISGITRGGDVDALAFLIMAHELGHQFGASHTFSGQRGRCQGNVSLATAWEAGSGSSPMAYAGGCPVGDAPPTDNIVLFADPYFHHGSIGQMKNFLGAASCPVQVSHANRAPLITSATVNTAIPPGTPFILSASATDADGDALVYSWEQFDSGVARALSGTGSADNGFGALFRTFPPVTDPRRTFPRMADVLSGTSTPGERLPTTTGVNRNFRVIVRDNHPGAGGTAASTSIAVHLAAGTTPFAITSPAPGAVLLPGSRSITWSVGGTDSAPISCASVTLRFSSDDGATFPLLLGTFPNTGQADVALPGAISMARVRIDPDDRIFFALSPRFSTLPCPADHNAAGGVTVQDIFDFLAAYFSGDPRSDFNGSGLPATVQDVFDFLAAYFAGCAG